jgi:two-component system, NarL family, sensor kinase
MVDQETSGSLLIIGSLAMIGMALALISFIYLYQRKMLKRQIAFRQIESLLKKQELKLTYATIEARESERKKIAEDLHDNMGSLLSSLRLYSDLLREKSGDGELQRIAGKLSELTEQTANETRRISHDLSTNVLQHVGIAEPIRQLGLAITESQKLDVTTIVAIETQPASEMALNIYRIVQELFTNTLKHANATRARLELTQIGNQYLSLIFEDNGKGFDTGEMKEGLGLISLKARVERLRGNVMISSDRSKGTAVIIEIPLT